MFGRLNWKRLRASVRARQVRDGTLPAPPTPGVMPAQTRAAITMGQRMKNALTGRARANQARQAAEAATVAVEAARAAELERLRTAETQRLDQRRAAVSRMAVTAFGIENQHALGSMRTAIAGAPDEATLSGLETACALAIPPALRQTARASHGHKIDEPDAPGPGGQLDSREIYSSRAAAMGPAKKDRT